mmetsp:Transcript_25749/g.50436  ORF Transcript_25749/g.50436 Transcript_25749/m.50436 type:complete len:93 (+) Transcript_25749:128-406(+)
MGKTMWFHSEAARCGEKVCTGGPCCGHLCTASMLDHDAILDAPQDKRTRPSGTPFKDLVVDSSHVPVNQATAEKPRSWSPEAGRHRSMSQQQ